MTLSQVLVFLLVAQRDLKGHPITFTEIKESLGANLSRSLHTTYKILLEPTARRPNGLGWLKSTENTDDLRQKFLTVTKKGLEVIAAVNSALDGGK